MTHDGRLLARIADNIAGTELGKFVAPHGIAIDSHGDIYVGEVSYTAWPFIYPKRPTPPGLRSLQKLVKTPGENQS